MMMEVLSALMMMMMEVFVGQSEIAIDEGSSIFLQDMYSARVVLV